MATPNEIIRASRFAGDPATSPAGASPSQAALATSAPLVVLGLVATGLAVLVVILWLTRSPSESPAGFPSYSDRPHSTVNGVTLVDYRDRAWLSYYERNAVLLGKPLVSERPYGQCPTAIVFENFIVCHVADLETQGTAWEFLPVLLGSMQQLPAGISGDSTAELAPIVQAYLADLDARQIDRWYWLGQVQSPAFCPPGKGSCFQVFQRQVLTWSASAAPDDVAAVRISALGAAVHGKR